MQHKQKDKPNYSLMKLKYLIPILTLAAGVLLSCNDDDKNSEQDSPKAMLTAIPSAKKIAQNGTASFTFKFNFTTWSNAPEDISKYTATINFSATGGSVSPETATTDATGSVTVVFTTTDPAGFTGGTVSATVIKIKGNNSDSFLQQGNLATARADVLPLNAKDPNVESLISKAESLKDNTYVIQKNDGEPQVFSFSQDDSQWYIGRSYSDRTKQAIKLYLLDEDTILSTMGWCDSELPVEISNELTTIDSDFYKKYSWAHAKFGTMRTGKEIHARVGNGGNIKLDGRSQIWLKEKSTKAYSGQYQFLFAFVFDDEIWDSQTHTYITGDTVYTVYGNAIVNEYFPTLDWFRIEPPTDWVKVGNSIILDADWTDGADFDWSRVKLTGQTLGYSSSDDINEGYFSWDAQTQTLTSVKSANNGNVYLKFAYEGTDMKTSCQIATGLGWDYTSFTLSPEYLVMGTSWGYLPVSVNTYAPTNLTWNKECLEIDPDSDPDEDFYYSNNGYIGSFSPQPGNYNIRLRVKSNHSVGYVIPIRVVEGETPSSFQILPEQDGTVGYGMGMELSVRTTPEDCYWNWSDVELMPGYDDLIFTGLGGRDDHPKLRTSKSHDPAVMGVQVGFRLKYDHSKKCFIYVTLD